MNRDFHLLFAAAAASRLGTSVGYVAMPLVAVTTLDATPGQVGLLATLTTVAFLAIGLPAGVWTDRVRRRGVMIAADVGRAVALGSVPLTWALGALRMEQLYAVAVVTGVGTVFFEVANQSYLPRVVGREALLAANARLVAMGGVTDIAGRGVAGYVVAVVTAPLAVLVDALSYLVSAVVVTRVRHREEAPSRERVAVWREMVEGVGFVAAHPLLRAMVLSGGLANLGIVMGLTMLPVVVVDELGWSTTALGLFLAIGGAGSLCGSLSARWLAARFDVRRVFLVGSVVAAPCGFGVPLIGVLPWVAALGWFVIAAQVGVNNVLNVNFRQQVTPDHLLGRVNATCRFLFTGAAAVAAAAAGVLGEVASPTAALFVGAGLIALVWAPMLAGRREPAPV